MYCNVLCIPPSKNIIVLQSAGKITKTVFLIFRRNLIRELETLKKKKKMDQKCRAYSRKHTKTQYKDLVAIVNDISDINSLWH